MPRGIVGLLAAVGIAMSVLASQARGYLFLIMLLVAAAATGLAGYAAAPSVPPTTRSLIGLPIKKCLDFNSPIMAKLIFE